MHSVTKRVAQPSSDRHGGRVRHIDFSKLGKMPRSSGQVPSKGEELPGRSYRKSVDVSRCVSKPTYSEA